MFLFLDCPVFLANLETQQDCSVIISLTYHDAEKVFRSRNDPGTVLVDWDIPDEFRMTMAMKMNREELIDSIRARNRTMNLVKQYPDNRSD